MCPLKTALRNQITLIPFRCGYLQPITPPPSTLPLFLLQNPLAFTPELGHSQTGPSVPAQGQPCAEPPPAQESYSGLA